MRRLIIAALLLLNATAFAQPKRMIATALQFGSKETYQDEYRWADARECEVTVTFNNGSVLIDNKLGTAIFLGRLTSRKTFGDGWIKLYDAVDEERKSCTWAECYYRSKQLLVVTVLYSDAALKYYLYGITFE